MGAKRLFSVLVVLFILAFGIPPQATRVAGAGPDLIFNVNTLEDLPDFVPNSVCSAGDPTAGACSLRAAIQEASVPGHSDLIIQINLPIGIYELTIDTPPYLNAKDGTFGDLDLPGMPEDSTSQLIIEGLGGPGYPSLIDANFIDRAFEIGPNQNVILKNIWIENGLVQAKAGVTAGGGAILVTGSDLKLEHVVLESNEARCLPGCNATIGGAIESNDSNLTISYARLQENKADFSSAIRFEELATVGEKYLTINASTIENNEARVFGTIANSGTMNLINSTMADNRSLGAGTAENIVINGPTDIQNSTIIATGAGSSLLVNNSLYLRNNILINQNPSGNICALKFASQLSYGGNVVSDSSCFPALAATDHLLSHPGAAVLGTLGYCGGSSLPVMCPIWGSPAIDRLNTSCRLWDPKLDSEFDLLVDQRSMPRDDGKCDSGAVEGFDLEAIFLPSVGR